jgi:hypothetical protein
MKAPFRRLPIAIALTGIMLFALSGIALANPVSKTIDTAACTSDPSQQCATYGLFGFTGTITFAADEVNTQIKVLDVICVNPINVQGDPTTGQGFNTVGIDPGPSATAASGSSATYTLTLQGTTFAPYTLPSGQDCSDGHYNPFLVDDPAGVLFTPTSATVSYSLTLAGVTAANANAAFGNKGVKFNSMLNKIYEPDANHSGVVTANSPSVGPPEGPPNPVPEAPLTILLMGTGALTAVWYVSRKLRQSVSLTAA